jgi:hypothetical protein
MDRGVCCPSEHLWAICCKTHWGRAAAGHGPTMDQEIRMGMERTMASGN